MLDINHYIEIINNAEKQSLQETTKESHKYYKGLSDKEKSKRKKDFEKNSKKDDDDPTAYEPVEGDDGENTKKSKYTKKYHQQFSESIKSVKNKADETGIPYKYLKKVYDRGMAAWKNGHRPNTTPQQWALARINSFATGGKTRYTADKDIWDEYQNNK